MVEEVLEYRILPLEDMAYCKYCGSMSFRMEKRVRSYATNIGGKVGLSFAGISGALSKGGNTTVSREYDTATCTICLGEQQPSTIRYEPITAKTSTGDTFVIPYSLALVLNQLRYVRNEIQQLISEVTRNIKKIRERYLERGGKNPCDEHKVGHRVLVKLKNGETTRCWVIVGEAEGKMAFRLAFGNPEGVC